MDAVSVAHHIWYFWGFFFWKEPEHWGANMHICEAQVCNYYSQPECYDLKFKTFAPTNPQSLSPLLTGTNCTPSSPPLPMCQVHLAWLWTPRCYILLKALLVEARILCNVWRWDHALEMWALAQEGRGGWKRKQKKMREAGACFSLGWKAAQKFLFCISLSAQTSDSLTSIRALSDCCTLICFHPAVTQTLIFRSWHFIPAGVTFLNLCGFCFKLQYNLTCSMCWFAYQRLGPIVLHTQEVW